MKKHLYLSGSKYDFDNREQFTNYITSQNTTVETMKNQYSETNLGKPYIIYRLQYIHSKQQF